MGKGKGDRRRLYDVLSWIQHKENGVAIVVVDKWRDNILEVNWISVRLITAKLLIDTINMNIVSAYVPHVGCTYEEKEEF